MSAQPVPPPLSERRRGELDALLDRHADEISDAALLAGVAMIERACARARESVEFRWRSYPRSEVRALRYSVRRGLALVRIGCLMREVDEERWFEQEAQRERGTGLDEQLLAEARRAG